MHIRQVIDEHIQKLKKTMITLEELESLFIGAEVETHEFATAIIELEQAGVLEEVKSAGRTLRSPTLAYRYRANKARLTQQHRQQLQQYRLQLHPAIQLDSYFSITGQQFEQDRPWIERIDRYLKQHGLPIEAVAAPERSYQLTDNEKWITELGGQVLLKRLGLWESLRIYPVSDPLMLAVNPTASQDKHQPYAKHLIVENKTTFQALLPVLPETDFHTLIYGCGNKITGNIEMFAFQYPVSDREHHFLYFGDLDYEGIRIWHDTNKIWTMLPALPFYEACLENTHALGKTNQRRREEAVLAFLDHFSPARKEQINACFAAGGYYPQETLTAKQLQSIWRSEQWNQLIDSN